MGMVDNLMKIIEGIKHRRTKRVVIIVVLCIVIGIGLNKLAESKPPFFKEVTIERDVIKQITGCVEIRLDGITTIGIQGWSNFKQYANPEEVLERIYTRISPPNVRRNAESDIENMDQEQWDKFVKELTRDNAAIVTDTKFAYLTIYVKGEPIDYFQNRIYCNDNIIEIPEKPICYVTLRVTHVRVVQGYEERDCVTVEIIKEKPLWLRWLLRLLHLFIEIFR